MRIVAVTACPTGIAHTYMAAEQLEKAAKAAGHTIRVETQGSMGIENELSSRDITEAEVAIFAVDIEVENKDRFEGKRIVKVGVAEAIKNPAAVLARAVSGT
ncbi:MAG: PTS fructose transporter subunit IIB [Phycisphaerales bacterium]|nr:MAG: PTS fructose transporter subunit IIB [Phycisphaerales bacterium]